MYAVLFSTLATQFFMTNAAGVAQSHDEGVQETWQDELLATPFSTPEPGRNSPMLQLVRQDFESLEFGQSVIKTPMVIGARNFQHGLGTHSVGHIRLHSPVPIQRFSAWIGVDNNQVTQNSVGSVVFSVSAGGVELYRSGIMRGGQILFPGQQHGFGDMTEYFFWIKSDYFCKHLIGDYADSVDILEMNRDIEKIGRGRR